MTLPVPVPKGPKAPDLDDQHHQRRVAAFIDWLPGWIRGAIRWLLRPESRWARIPAGVLLTIGGFLGMLPVMGFWMLPLGLFLIGEDAPVVRRGLARLLGWVENRRPHWFKPPGGD